MPPIETPLQRARREERAQIIADNRRRRLAREARLAGQAVPRPARVVPRAVPRPVQAAPDRPAVVWNNWHRFQQQVEQDGFNWNFGQVQRGAIPVADPAPEPPEPQLNAFDLRNVIDRAAVRGAERVEEALAREQLDFEERHDLDIQAAIPQAQNPPSVAKIEKEADEMPERLANTFLVGCDPEFVVMDKADTVLNNATVGIGPKGEVGYDHSGLVLEIRPAAAKGTYALMKRIKQIIDNNDKLKLVNGKKWRAGAVVKTKLVGRGDGIGGQPERTLTLGGHVHLDLPPVGYGGVDQDLHNIRLSAMDRMTKYLEGLDILPKNESAIRREEGAKAMPGSRYGQWGDWRTAGGEAERTPVRLEYRTPASWLYSQQATFLTLTGVKLAMVSPQLAMDTLKIRNVSYENLKAFFELYRHKDANARRVLDCLLDKRVEDLQADPDRDVREAWKTLEF